MDETGQVDTADETVTYDDEVSAHEHALALADALLGLARAVEKMLNEVRPEDIPEPWFNLLRDHLGTVTEQVVWQGLEL